MTVNGAILRLGTLAAVVALVGSACTGGGADTTTTTGPVTTPTQPEPLPGPPGSVLAEVRNRGVLKCGVVEEPPFAERLPDGAVLGFDADLCRAVAAAVLGDAHAVEFTTLSSGQALAAVQNGEIDLLMGGESRSQGGEATEGVSFGPATFFDGQQFLARSEDGFSVDSTLVDLDGAVVCVVAGSLEELRLTEALSDLDIEVAVLPADSFVEAADDFAAGRCIVLTAVGSALAGVRASPPPAESEGDEVEEEGEWIIFPSVPLTREQYGPAYRAGDSAWADVVDWTVFAVLIFYEHGVTSSNAAAMRQEPPTAEIDRLLGGPGELQTAMNLSADAFFNVVFQMGNYAEIFARNLGPAGLTLEGTVNDLAVNGGLMYPPPAR